MALVGGITGAHARDMTTVLPEPTTGRGPWCSNAAVNQTQTAEAIRRHADNRDDDDNSEYTLAFV
jgi:hypothetical protein